MLGTLAISYGLGAIDAQEVTQVVVAFFTHWESQEAGLRSCKIVHESASVINSASFLVAKMQN